MKHSRWSRREFLRSGGLAIAGAAGGLGVALGGGQAGVWTTPVASAAGPVKGGILKVAQIGDPPTLDPMSTTADVTATDSQSIFETLFALDANGVPSPCWPRARTGPTGA